MQVVRGRGVITDLHCPVWEESALLIEPEAYVLTLECTMIYNFNWIIFLTPFLFPRRQRRFVLAAVL